MLKYYPSKRASAQECLRHYWFKIPTGPYKLTEAEIHKKASQKNKTNTLNYSNLEEHDSEHFYASSEDNKTSGNSTDDSDRDDDHDNYGYVHVLNRSYQKEGQYMPYGGGIDFELLDQDPNWQFVDADVIESK